MMIEYVRVREDVKPPERANPSDAGLDVFFCPDDAAVGAVKIPVGGSVILATGLRFGIPHGYMLQAMNRSGVAAKRSLVVGAHVIDSGYDGEVFINLHNIGTERQIVKSGDKIAQLVMIPVVPFRALETNTGNLYDWYPITMSGRGDGALGSTGE
jgi:dUTP pyrophosphatase